MSQHRKGVVPVRDTTTDLGIDLREVYARNDSARRLTASLAAAMPGAVSETWYQVDQALADIPALGAIIARLAAELKATRLDRAILLAAMRATLAAHADGEEDPLFYLRDELSVPHRQPRATHRGQP